MKKIMLLSIFCLVLIFCLWQNIIPPPSDFNAIQVSEDGKSYIKWIDFSVSYDALCDAMNVDIESYGTDSHYLWTDILAYFASKNGGNFSSYKTKDMNKLLETLKDDPDIEHHVLNKKLYAYYKEAYAAVLGGLIGSYTRVSVEENGTETRTEGYGLRAFSPIADGYYYADYDDFGASRSYGYKRSHLGHDLMGSIGTPIIAVESGYVEVCGWNQYGGWRIGIRSFDGKRYYYYAHLKKNHPFNDIYTGKIVNAGEVIGYLGMTGYSSRENTNNIDTPHLHYGLQIIFDISQKDGVNQIWIDMYTLTRFLAQNRVLAYKADKEYNSKEYYEYTETPD